MGRGSIVQGLLIILFILNSTYSQDILPSPAVAESDSRFEVGPQTQSVFQAASDDDLLYRTGILPFIFEDLVLQDAKGDDYLPAPDEVDDFVSPFLPETQIGNRFTLVPISRFTGDTTQNVDTAISADLNFGIFHDTGFITGTDESNTLFDVTMVGLNDPAASGQTTMYEYTGDLKWDNQIKNFADGRVQTFVSLNLFDDPDQPIRKAFGRFISAEDEHEFDFGQAPSMFGDVGTVPKSIISGILPVGVAGYSRSNSGESFEVRQLQYRRKLTDDGWRFGIGIEQTVNDLPAAGSGRPGGTIELDRYPTFVAQLRHQEKGQWESFQVAALARGVGYDGDGVEEQFVSGWGVSGNARFFLNKEKTDTVLAGVAGGEGLGQYLAAGSFSAALDSSGELQALDSLGAYAGIQHLWPDNDKTDDSIVWSNVAWSYLYSDLGPTVPATTNARLEQAWANVIWQVRSNVRMGFEYVYGRREVRDGRVADNHRFHFVLKLSTGRKPLTKRTAASTNRL